MTFGAHKLVHSVPFLDYRYEFWHLLSALYSDMRKNFYIGTHLHSGIFFEIPQLSIRSGAQTFPPIFWIFAIFDRHFSEFVAPPTNENENYVAHLKEQSLLKKTPKTSSKSAYKRQRNACSNYAPIERTLQCTGLGAWQTQKNKHHIFAPTAGAQCAIFPKLCRMIELVVPIKNLSSFFDPMNSFYRVHGKIRPNWPTRGCSAITP